MSTKIMIDPITRLEGHGKIHIFMDDAGAVDRAFLQIPELRGFEKFVEGRRAEEMPQITSRICGVCPTAHHMAATKALDDLYGVDPPQAAKKIRELVYSIFMVEDHALHFFFLGGPDFVVGPAAPKADRNILGVIGKVGLDIGKEVIGVRKQLRELMGQIAGKPIHPVFGLPGGVSRTLTAELRDELQAAAVHAVQFGTFALGLFRDVVLANPEYVELVTSEAYTHRTYYMGLVDAANKVTFYDGTLRVVDPGGQEFLAFDPRDYLGHIAEHVEPWSYMKFCFLKDVGWKGFAEGPESGVYGVAPLARLNASDGMATPLAQEAYEELVSTLGGKPVHHTLANHWARIVELVYAAERMSELAADPEILSPDIRTLPTATPDEGIGVVEAPRGTLIHHYRTDERGLITSANLIVATQNNAARIAMSVDKAARWLITGDKVDEGLLNQLEMAFRAYDPCFGCATHSLPGQMPLLVQIHDPDGEVVRELRRD
jgi:F420-non-reducing hydrogenase large subunit